uniref:Uncharacterized protein n=1 Tax=Klebsiella pneumoniae TaxID=573 RepID=A0A3G4RJC9_KLEPN|nr:hypothetical protein [Klebsiella pneumoniae]
MLPNQTDQPRHAATACASRVKVMGFLVLMNRYTECEKIDIFLREL